MIHFGIAFVLVNHCIDPRLAGSRLGILDFWHGYVVSYSRSAGSRWDTLVFWHGICFLDGKQA